MSLEYPQLPIFTIKDNLLITKEDYIVKGIEIPLGTLTDGLTLKVGLFRLIVSKYEPKFLVFALLHDYLCDLGQYELADKLGAELLLSIENSTRTKGMLFFIKAYHYFTQTLPEKIKTTFNKS